MAVKDVTDARKNRRNRGTTSPNPIVKWDKETYHAMQDASGNMFLRLESVIPIHEDGFAGRPRLNLTIGKNRRTIRFDEIYFSGDKQELIRSEISDFLEMMLSLRSKIEGEDIINGNVKDSLEFEEDLEKFQNEEES